MYKVAHKMACVCDRWTDVPGPSAGRTEWDDLVAEITQSTHTQPHPHIHRFFAKNRWKTDMQFIFFYKVRNKRNV